MPTWVGTWRPHRPRAPIAALYGGPGPKYGLPTNVGFRLHDPSRHRAPAYSFGTRTAGPRTDGSPGPAYLVPPGTTAHGPARSPAFSIYGRPRDLEPFRTPAPGRYFPEKAERFAYPTAPACSMRARTAERPRDHTPGPAAYHLPPMLGPRIVTKTSAPNFSMPGRSNVGAFYQDLCKTPGPCNYRVVGPDAYKRRAPHYSMQPRPAPPRVPSTPGPGQYSPQMGRPQGRTFGIRHSEFLTPLIVDVPP